ncbi:ABC transporter [Actinoplanes sp. ATCC 53533]|uniref:ABC transporter permease n=1 Tax=Actinoplanes sp. ATCC 53533 TaxID=1288362 RepID=UPI000F7B9538|nr:ABC transporter permease [Actinoplanes sp. ATCC 53533]RSM69431.1 ABC transporter [Actinoplanes sp. ATCC 53533]
MPIVDLLDEATAGLLARPGRMLLTAAGTVLGIAALVGIAGITTTASNHIVARFDALAVTEVVVTPAARAADEAVVNVLPWDAEKRLTRLRGVLAAGTMTPVDAGDETVRRLPVVDPLQPADQNLAIFAGSPGLLGAVQGVVGTGRWFDAGHNARADRVAVLGRAAADRLGITGVEHSPAIFIGDDAFTVIGILAEVQREPDLLNAVLIPDGLARAAFGLDAPASVHVHTALGAARAVGAVAALALAPNAPEQLAVRTPPDPEQVRARVADDLRALFFLLGAVSLVVGGLGIANTTLVGVLERTTEIGLRRSLGALRRHIAVQFLVEAVTVGILGGVVGTSLGVLVTVAVAAVRSWSPVLDPWIPIGAVGAGALLGLLAGTYPAWRAATIEPIAALRTEL